MAQHRYLSYRTRRNQRQRRIYLGVAAVVVIVVVIILLWPGSKPQESIARLGQEAATGEPVPASRPPTQPQPAPGSRDVAGPEPGPLTESEYARAYDVFAQPTPGETVEVNPEAAKLIDQATGLIKAEGIIAARDILNDVLIMPLSHEQRREVKSTLAGLANKWLFSRDVLPGDTLCAQYKVQHGDLLSKIAGRYKVPHEILMEINNIERAEALRAGDTIKVISGPFHARVYLSTYTMDVYLQRAYVRSFRIGHGRPGKETPTGLWRVKKNGKLVKPVWTDRDTDRTYHPDDPDYPLGSRWIALDGLAGRAKGRTGFAIHGTNKPEEIGTSGSKGCIRLHNGDVILLYKLLAPVLSEIRVED